MLGGIASFTLVDKDTVKPRDLGNNFMLRTADFGESKAKAIAAHLKELNASVVGSFIDEDPDDIVSENPDFFHDFTIVIATQMHNRALIALDGVCQRRNITMIMLRSFGLLGTLRLSLKEHFITEATPTECFVDLRLTHPWPELSSFASDFELDSLDSVSFQRVPYIVLLLQAASNWRSEHDGMLPKSNDEQAEFKRVLSAMRRTHDEDNFQEALNAVRHICKPPSLSPNVVELLEALASKSLAQSTSSFWFKIYGLSSFLAQSGGLMPLEGSLPDMICTTEHYVTLQQIYQEKAASDAKIVEGFVQEALILAGRERDAITFTEVRNFCKHASSVRILRWQPLSLDKNFEREDVIESTQRPAWNHSLARLTYFFLMCASDTFYDRYGRFPGTAIDAASDSQDDYIKLKAIANEALRDKCLNVHVGAVDDLIREMVRCGDGEAHAVASVLGAIGSQEVIKMVTKQFVPCEKTLIYNAAESTTMTFP